MICRKKKHISFWLSIFQMMQSMLVKNFCISQSIQLNSPLTPFTRTCAKYLLLSARRATACFLVSFKQFINSLTMYSKRSPCGLVIFCGTWFYCLFILLLIADYRLLVDDALFQNGCYSEYDKDIDSLILLFWALLLPYCVLPLLVP